MAFWQPRSVLQLLLLGFFTALAPLSLAILFTVQTLAGLAEDNREITRTVVDVTRLGEEIQDAVLELERRARQYVALGDEDLGELFSRERAVLLEKLARLPTMPTESPDVAGLQNSLEKLTLTLLTDAAGFGAPASDGLTSQRLEQAFEVISFQREAIEKWLLSSVDQMLEKTAADAEAIIDALVLQVSSLALATLALLLFFAYWINKPVQDLTQEIHQLGTGGLSHTIEISGPQEVQMLGSKLEWLRSRLHDSDQQKQQFLRHISHELKTPLSSLREGTDLLADRVTGGLSQQQQEIVEILSQNAIELQRLIENLLDYNQVPSQELRLEDIRIEAMIENLLESYSISINKKGLRVKMGGSINTWLADASKFSTTLDNLVSNAVVYCPEEGIIDIAWRMEDASLIVDVANSGEPIPREDAERLFEPFFQGASKRSGPIKGSGIGLSVARECIEVQGGSLELAIHERLPICFRMTCPAQRS
jgi:two-component system sensor histidine kinase GlrK